MDSVTVVHFPEMIFMPDKANLSHWKGWAQWCYICKLGWLDHEDTPELVEHEGLWYCESCMKVIAERLKKGQ